MTALVAEAGDQLKVTAEGFRVPARPRIAARPTWPCSIWLRAAGC